MRRIVRTGIIVWALVFPLVGGTGLAVEVGGSNDDIGSVDLEKNIEPDGSIVGVIANHSDKTVKDIRVLVRHSWRWQNEFRPGENDPSRAEYISVPGELPPGDSVDFRYNPVPALPERSDGRFLTTAQVVSFDEISYKIVK